MLRIVLETIYDIQLVIGDGIYHWCVPLADAVRVVGSVLHGEDLVFTNFYHPIVVFPWVKIIIVYVW